MIILLIAAFTAPLFADLTDFVLSPILYPPNAGQIEALLQDTPIVEAALHLEYADLYDYRNEKERLSDGTLGRVEKKADYHSTQMIFYARSRHLRAGVTRLSSDFNGSISNGGDQKEFHSSAATNRILAGHGLISAGPAAFGGGMDSKGAHQYLFARAGWNIFYGMYSFLIDDIPLMFSLRPATLTKRLDFNLRRKIGRYEAGVDLGPLRFSLFTGPLSLFQDSTRHSGDNMASQLYLSGSRSGFRLTARGLPFKPYLACAVSGQSGYWLGFYNNVRYGRLDGLILQTQTLEGGVVIPWDLEISASRHDIGVSGATGYLEASPFNVWNFFSHTYYKLRDPDFRCSEKTASVGRTFSFSRHPLELNIRAGYDQVEFHSRFFYKERESMTLIGPIGWPYYGEEKQETPADEKQDFVFLRSTISYPVRGFRFVFGGEQYVPLPDRLFGEKHGVSPAGGETRPAVFGGMRLKFGVLYSRG